MGWPDPMKLIGMITGEWAILHDPGGWGVLEDHADFQKSRQEWQTMNFKYVVTAVVVLCSYYMWSSGFHTPMHMVVRVNNCLTIALVCIVYLLRVGLRDQYFPKKRHNQIAWFESCCMFTCVVHYTLYTTLTWGRLQELLLIMVGGPVENLGGSLEDLGLGEADMLGDPYSVMYSIVAVSCCAHLHILPSSGLLAMALFSPIQWALQCLLLGTNLDLGQWLRVAGLFFVSSLLSFLGGRRSNMDHLKDYVQMQMERLQVRQIFSQASVPIFIVGRKPGSPTESQVELWNSSLEALTQISVSSGTMLREVACLRAGSCSALLSTIEQALCGVDPPAQCTLVPIVGATGVVWLQVNVSPFNNGTKAVIIGSDVTEFVNRHSSLLHFVPEEGPGEQQRDQNKSWQGSATSALLDPHGLTVLDCSPGFNIVMQRRMRGRPFLNYVAAEDRRIVKEVVEAVLSGKDTVPITVSIRGSEEDDRRSHRRSKPPSSNSRRVSLRFSVAMEEGSLQVEVRDAVDEEADNTARVDYSSSDPGMNEPVKGLGSGSTGSDPHARSEGEANTLPQARWIDDMVPGGEVPGEHGGSSATSSKDCLNMDALVIHLIDLSRHFNLPSFVESVQYLLSAVRRINDNVHSYEQRWGRRCQDWQCQLCLASNDGEDEICEVCKLGEPQGAHPDVVEL